MSLITKPNNLVDGTTAFGSETDANFNTIYNDYNGNILDANIAANAGIVGSKLADNTLNIEKLNLEDYIGGLRLSNDTDSDHDVNCISGACRSDDNTEGLTLAAEITKRIDANFAVGDDGGGLDTDTVVANTTYAIWLIKRTDTDVVDMIFSLSFTSPTLPTNYDRQRLIGFVVTDGSANIIGFNHRGGVYFRFTGDIITDVNDGTIVNDVFEVGTLSVPPAALAHIYTRLVNAASTDASGYINVRFNGAADFGSTESFMMTDMGGSTFDQLNAQGFVLVDDSSRIQYAAAEDSGSATAQIRTIGCIMLTRDHPIN